MARIILIVFALVVGAPILIMLGMAALGSAAAAVYVGKMMSLLGMTDPPKKKGWDVVNVRRGSPMMEGFRAITEPEKMQDLRVVLVKAVIGLDDIKIGQRPTNPDEQANFVKINLPQLAAEECSRLKQVLAAQCVVTETNAVDVSRGLFQVMMVLNYTVKDAFGTVPADSPLLFAEINQNLGEGGQPRLITRGQQQDARLGMYRKAATLCQATRNQKGNCAINHLIIDVVPDRTGWNTIRMSGTAKLAFLERQPK